jgi:Fur family ferric uptake transcriptional regulator
MKTSKKAIGKRASLQTGKDLKKKNDPREDESSSREGPFSPGIEVDSTSSGRPRRNTRQKEAMMSVFLKVGHPLSPVDLCQRAKKNCASINQATVYRNLKQLLEFGDIVPVEVPGKPDRYELAGQHHHHHFLCNVCDRLYDIKGCVPGINSLAPVGYTVDTHHITLMGICSSCNPPSQR